MKRIHSTVGSAIVLPPARRLADKPLSAKQVAVRVLWPAASNLPPGSTAESLYFQAIESRLK